MRQQFELQRVVSREHTTWRFLKIYNARKIYKKHEICTGNILHIFCDCDGKLATSANSVKSDLGCTSRLYFDNVTLTSHNVTLTSQKPCQYNNKLERLTIQQDSINEVKVGFFNKI